MKTIRDLSAPPHVRGRIETIIVRGSPREAARSVEATQGGAIRLRDEVKVQPHTGSVFSS